MNPACQLRLAFSLLLYLFPGRLAETVVTSDVTNNADVGREAEFDMLLPQDAFITSITIKLPNETIHGVIQEKKKAKRVYDKVNYGTMYHSSDSYLFTIKIKSIYFASCSSHFLCFFLINEDCNY